jgi:SET domain-containing protein
MKKILYTKKIKDKGRGVFCKQRICKDEAFEVCHVIVIPAIDYDTVKASRLVDYFFSFNKEENTLALALGFGSLYNHAVDSNAVYYLNREEKIITFYALEDIPSGKEICINYAGERGKEFKEWFEERNITYKAK